MATLTFPILPDGLVVDVVVNLEAAVLMPLRLSGGGPAPFQGKGLIDTGSDITAVALPVLQRLGSPAVQQTTTQGIGGLVPVNLHRVSLHVLDARNVSLAWLSQPSLLVMELVHGFPFDILVGLDIVLTSKMLVDGPGRVFSLDF